MFGKVMQNPELCRELLQRIFPKLAIDRVEYPEPQKSIRPDADAKSVRLDVYVKDGMGTVYDIEMQITDTKELPKRTRYYQSMIDLQMIDKGQMYKHLNQSYIIFISPFDVFGKGRHIYTFENYCIEDKDLSLNDGTAKVFLNAAGEMDDVSRELKAFLDYVAGKETKDAFVEKLKEAVEQAKKSREWRHEYMTLFMRDQENLEKGIQIGKAEGRAEGEAKGRAEGIQIGEAKGRVEGRAYGILEFLEDFGSLSDSLRSLIMSQTDLDILKQWNKLAARAESIEDFARKAGLSV